MITKESSKANLLGELFNLAELLQGKNPFLDKIDEETKGLIEQYHKNVQEYKRYYGEDFTDPFVDVNTYQNSSAFLQGLLLCQVNSKSMVSQLIEKHGLNKERKVSARMLVDVNEKQAPVLGKEEGYKLR